MSKMPSLDSRVRKPKGVKTFARYEGVLLDGEVVSCLSCGHPAGQVTAGMPPGVFYLCATNPGGCGCNCEGKYGRPDEMFTPVPDPPSFHRVMVTKPANYPAASTASTGPVIVPGVIVPESHRLDSTRKD